MATDSLSVWKSEWDNLPLDGTGATGGINVSQYVGDRLTGKLSLAPPMSGGFSFTFNVSAMAAILSTAVPDVSALPGATKFADAWAAGMNGAIVLVSSGAFVGSSSPGTTFSAPPVSAPGPGIAIARAALINDLISLTPTTMSEVPEKIRNAVLASNYVHTGLNSVTPTPGPLIAVGGVQ